jgi:ABC-2 type transport system permease protein
MNKILVIVQKEWLDLRQHPMLVLSMVALPAIFIAMPLLTLLGGKLNGIPESMLTGNPDFAGMSEAELTQALVLQQLRVLFLILPLALPNIIAAYSIVGEKTNRTLEPLLAAPVHTWELLVGKGLAAFLPAVVVTWLGGAIFVVEVGAISNSARVLSVVVNSGWLIVLIIAAPLMALLGIAVAIIISSRVNDPRTAQQLSGLLILPVLGGMFLQVTGVLVANPILGLLIAAALVLLTALSVWIAVKVFQREYILTRWS